MADNRLYGGDVINPAMMGGANVQPKQQALSGYTGSGQSNIGVRADLTEYDPYHRLKMATLGMVGQSLQLGMEAEKERAYMDGMSKAISGQAEDAIESNFLTRNYGRAGYRDTEGKLALLDYKARALSDLEKDPLLSRLTPEGYQQYLSQRKQEVMSYISNASTKTKGKLMEQLLAEDFSLVQKQAQLYTSSVFNDEVSYYGKQMNLSIVDLNGSRGGSTYEASAMGAGLTIQDVLTNDRLDFTAKQKLVSDYLDALSTNGHSDLARQLTQGTQFDIDGTNTTLAEWMSFDQFTKVTDGQNKGDKAWRDDRLKQVRMGILDLEERAKTDPNFDFDTSTAEVYSLIGNGGLSSAEGFRTIKDLVKTRQSNKDNYDVLRYLFNGDRVKLVEAGVSEANAVKQYFQTFKDKTAPEKMSDLVGIANNGITEALKGVGTVAEPMLTRLMNSGDGNINDEDVQILNTFVSLFNQKDFTENPQLSFDGVMAGIQNDNTAIFLRGAMNRYMDSVPGRMSQGEQSQSWENALQEQRAFMMENPQTRESITRRSNEAKKLVRANQGGGQYSAFNFLRMSPINRDKSKGIKPGAEFRTWANFVPFVNMGQGGNALNYAVGEEFRNQAEAQVDIMAQGGVLGSPEELEKRASEVVAQASFFIDGDGYAGSFVGNPSSPVSNYLANDPSFDKRSYSESELATEAITNLTSKAVDQWKQTGAGQGWNEFKVMAKVSGGRLVVNAWDNGTGIQMPSKSYDLREVSKEAQRVADDWQLTADSEVAQGYKVYVPNPDKVQSKAGAKVSGRGYRTAQNHATDISLNINSALDPKWKGSLKVSNEEIIATRTSLIEHEGVRLQRYKDGSGYSVGVGIHTGNSNIFPSRIKSDTDVLTKEELQNSFISASTYAMNLADKASKGAPESLDLPKYRMLLTHMAYQQGSLTDEDSKAFIEAVKARDLDTAQSLLENTRAYKASGVDRRNFYRNLLESL